MANLGGGDEVNALVVDLGTHTCKAGYAGDDCPKAYFPSVGGVTKETADANGMEVDNQPQQTTRKVHVGHSAINFRRPGMEIQSPFNAEDIVGDWDVAEALYAHALNHLGVKPEEFAMLLAEPSHNSREARETLVELFFEKFDVPALFLAKAAVLTSFATARQTSLVVDCGHKATTVCAVHDGYVLNKSITRSPLAGQALTQCLHSALKAKKTEVRSRFAIKRVETTPGSGVYKVEDVTDSGLTASFLNYHTEQAVADIKESVCRVADGQYDEEELKQIPAVTYELPDGNEIHVGVERFKVPEALFQPALLSTFAGVDHIPKDTPALQELVLQSINKCDVDVRKDLYSGVVPTGGTSAITGMRERLEQQLFSLGPQTAKIKVIAPANVMERKYSTWIGGSILASLGSFQQMWMSKKEYQEHGAGYMHRKAP